LVYYIEKLKEVTPSLQFHNIPV